MSRGEELHRLEDEEALLREASYHEAFVEVATSIAALRTVEDLCAFILERAKELTGATIGYVGTIDSQTGALVASTMTADVWSECQVADKRVVFEKFSGLWGWVLDNKESVLTNAPAEDPRSTGAPPGHLPIRSFLSVPVLADGALLGQISLANSPGGFDGRDLECIESFAALFAATLTRFREEESLRKRNLELEELLRVKTDELAQAQETLQDEIEEKDLAIHALEESERQLKLIFDGSRDCIFIHPIEAGHPGTYIDVNRSSCDILGYSREELLGLGPAETIVVDDPAVMAEIGQKIACDGNALFEASAKTKDGREIPVEVQSHLVKAGDQEVVVSVARDVRERRAAEKTLLVFLDGIRESAFLMDKAGTVIASNTFTAQRLGLTLGQFIGMKAVDALPEQLARRRWAHVEKAIQTKQPITFEDERDEQTIYNSIYPILNEEDEVDRIAVLGVDITERVRTERALREQSAFNAAVIEHAAEGMSVCHSVPKNPSLEFTIWNDRMREISGYTREQINEQGILGTLIRGEALEQQARERLARLRAGEDLKDDEWGFTRADGSQRKVRISTTTIGTNDKLTHHLFLVSDITERKRLEAQLHEAHTMDAIATLAGGVAHQFNNALSVIIGNIALLEEDHRDDQELLSSLELMRESSRRMTRLTSQLLAYAQGGKYVTRPLLLNDFLRDTLPLLEHTIRSGIHVEANLEEDGAIVEADHTQLQMLLSALLSNAVEAIIGEGRIQISTRTLTAEEGAREAPAGEGAWHEQAYVKLSVTDDGVGMSEDTRSRVFEPFFSTKFQGRGLGMAAVYGIVRNHHGWISVTSKRGAGTTVEVSLPICRSHEQSPSSHPTVRSVARRSGTILLVEDNEVVMRVSEKILRRLGYDVVSCLNGNEAIQRAQTHEGVIDAAIIDVILPDISGLEVFNRVLKIHPDLKVLVSSGFTLQGQALEILQSGAHGFLKKPFTLAELDQKLLQVLGRL